MNWIVLKFEVHVGIKHALVAGAEYFRQYILQRLCYSTPKVQLLCGEAYFVLGAITFRFGTCIVDVLDGVSSICTLNSINVLNDERHSWRLLPSFFLVIEVRPTDYFTDL